MPPPRTGAPLTLVRSAPEGARAPADDASLARALRDGDRDAAGRLFDRFGPLVNLVLHRILGGGPDHDDRVQETFIEVVRSIQSLRDDGALRAWVTTIAARVARSELRRRRVRRFFLLPVDELPEPPCDDDHPAREALRETFRVMDALSPDERVAFALRYLHGEELSAVAEACGCSLATVKRRLARAEQRFVTQCEKHPELAARIARGRWSPL